MGNIVILTGRTGADPEVRTFDNGMKKAEVSLATTTKWKKDGERQERTEWHKLVFWGKLVDVVEMFVQKGHLIQVVGEIRYRSYEKDGVTRYITEIYVERMDMLTSRGESNSDAGNDAEPDRVPVPPDPLEPSDDLPF
jgi:single-strand DNA-binding protein